MVKKVQFISKMTTRAQHYQNDSVFADIQNSGITKITQFSTKNLRKAYGTRQCLTGLDSLQEITYRRLSVTILLLLKQRPQEKLQVLSNPYGLQMLGHKSGSSQVHRAYIIQLWACAAVCGAPRLSICPVELC